ncbi:MAG: pyruvate dehydrogenase (acetyl-transferring), homodimeric type [Candidatus Eisenbacteria bacterium]
MIFEQFKQQLPDLDPEETNEWVEALDAVVERDGRARAQFLLYRLLKLARLKNVGLPPTVQTRYINTISPEQEPPFPGDEDLERRIRRLIRWNAAVMVHRANHEHPGIGGHLSTYASAASLYEVGFNHFFRGKDGDQVGDQIFFQGHGAPGIYARAYLEGRLSEDHLEFFRREVLGQGLSSYPHPRLMPDFWEYPTVSMGLGPINAIYQARFNRYLHNRGIADTSRRRVWCYLGDGETDEPEALGALSLAAREGLDNLIFVVNCNLQRLDGPVRGNGKIIQELESVFRGAGWNVVKVIWGREWDDLLHRDESGVLLQKMSETLDGDYQRFSVESGAYIREHFFGPDQRLRDLVAHLSDDDLKHLRRGGHDYRKVYAAYQVATEKTGVPTCILAKTVKGWTLGKSFEASNPTHQMKKLSEDELRAFRDRLELPIPDDKLKDPPYYHPGVKSREIEYMLERRRALGGCVPKRVVKPARVALPSEDLYKEFASGTAGSVPVSTTMVLVRLLRKLLKDDKLGKRVVPIVPDEARTFGMESLFREFKIYAAMGQHYRPVDAEFLLSYSEARDGQILEEGITESGGLASFTAAGTSYAAHREPMIPFFIFYSMFGFQRVGDLIWAAADSRARGFLCGATAGRTTLNGEGLQHEDGHSLVNASTVPSCVAYDPAFAFEIAALVKDGLRRMYENDEDLIYYLTLYNENYEMPPMPEGVEEGIRRGLYRFRPALDGRVAQVRLFGSGSIMQQVLAAQEMLAEGFHIPAEVWSVTSYGELRREALATERWNRLHPASTPRMPYVTRALSGEGSTSRRGAKGSVSSLSAAAAAPPIIAATDYVRTVPDFVSRWVPGSYTVLGTDGFGRSDTREGLRRFFEIDAAHIAAAALSSLAASGAISPGDAEKGIKKLGIDPEAPDPARG